jgi:enoyl-CoA hydratase/carnithine racemase
MALALAGNPSAGLDAEAAMFAAIFGSADQREGMRAFLEKRRAVFES